MSVLKIYLTKSPKSNKKFRIQYTQDGKVVKVDFGAAGMSDYTIHKDPSRMARYVARHGDGQEGWNPTVKRLMAKQKLLKKKKKNLSKAEMQTIHENMMSYNTSPTENWKRSGINSAGFWSRWLTWSEPSLQKAIRLINQKFKVKVIRKSEYNFNMVKKLKRKSRKPKKKSRRPKKKSRRPKKKSRRPKRKGLKFRMVPDNVVDKELYAKVKAEVKRKVKAWPSAYASGQVVRTYKSRGGRYKGVKKKSIGLTRWFDEKWINVCKLPKKVACGRPKSTDMATWKKKYPYCRPSVKVTKGTPRIASSLTKQQIKSRCRRKKENPKKRILK